MGKNKYKRTNNKRRNKGKGQYVPVIPLSEAEQDQLTNEAVSAMSLLQKAKEELSQQDNNSIGYVLSKAWLEQWKTHVGYDALVKGEPPAGRKYGRCKPGPLNEDIISKNHYDEYHKVPNGYEVLDLPLKPDIQPSKDFVLVSQGTWDFFYSLYGGTGIPRHRNSQGEFDFKMVRPYCVLMTDPVIEEIIQLKESQLQNSVHMLPMKRIQQPSNWDYSQMRQYLQLLMGVKDQVNLRIWRLESFIPIDTLKSSLLRSIHSKKFALRGELLDFEQTNPNGENAQENLKLHQFVKNHYTYLVEARRKPSDEFSFVRSDKTGTAESAGICEQCSLKQKLSYHCVCKRAFYCGLKCKYSDQTFHINTCIFAYDSDDDQDLEDIRDDSQAHCGRGLSNMGNTCYMNSAIQSMLSSSNFQKFLLNRQYFPMSKEMVFHCTMNKFQSQKRKYMLSFKLEKMLKSLMYLEKEGPFTPISFRSQFTKVHPYFGHSHQMDSAEFLFYLFDTLNDECSGSVEKNTQPELQQMVEIDDIPSKEQPVDDSEDSDSDEETKEESKKQEEIPEAVKFQQFKQFKAANQDYDATNPLNVWNNLEKSKSQLITKNFLGLLKSNISCPICQQTTTTFDPMLILPLPINQQQEFAVNQLPQMCQFIDAYVVAHQWVKGFQKVRLRYEQKTTMISDLKIQLAEQLGYDPQTLMGTISSDCFINSFIYHEEDLVIDGAKAAINDDNRFLVFYEIEKTLIEMGENEIFVGVETYCTEVRQGFSSYAERQNFGLPHLIIINKDKPLSHIMQQLFHVMGPHSNSADLLNYVVEDDENEDPNNIDNAILTSTIPQLLGYSIQIQYKLPFKVKCAFSCGKNYKKEQSEHQCNLPYNTKVNLSEYLERINYKDGFLSLILDWDLKHPPAEFRPRFDISQKQKSKLPVQTLDQCFQAFQREEELKEDNAYYCEMCKDLSLAYKQFSLYRAPNQLIIQLKRFQFDPIKGQFNKILTLIDYPMQIDIDVNESKVQYELYGVVLHFGTLENGHYMAYGKRENQWFEFNDEKVHPVKEENVLGDSAAYLLMYQAH